VTQMVLSEQPNRPLETARAFAAKTDFEPSKVEGQGIFEPGACGQPGWDLEQVARMSLRRVVPRNKTFSMRTLIIQAGAVLLLCGGFLASAPAHAQSASSWDKRGQAAEAREDYDVAFEAYRQAHLKKPTDLRYRTHYERLRFEAGNMHVDRGRVLRNSGDVDGAINEFARALQIDPGNQAAAQELQVSEKPKPDGSGAAAPPGGAGGGAVSSSFGEQTQRQKQVMRDISSMEGPVELQPVNDDPITLHMVEDTKVIYQAIGKAAGLNVIFDPDYTSKRIPVDLTSMSLVDALRVVGTLSGTFWKPVTTNTIFVAQNNRTKRTDLDDLAVETFYLTNVSQQNDANEILVALRNLFDPSTKMFLIASQNAIVMRATPEELILAEKIINDLDRTRSEVVVDVAVLEVSRQLERDLGITLPTSFGLTPQYSNQNITNTTTNTTNTTGTTTTGTSTSSLTLNTLGNLNATNFAISLTGGQVNALLSDSDTRILQNPRIRATDGQNATLKIGSKIPVATGSYSAGAAITTASLGVQTQFTYLDVGVNIDITPTVHYDREVSLKLKIEISAQTSSVTISGVTEPIISQRVVQQVIQLKDGEPSILAGLLQEQDQKNVSGTPGLGEIPFIKYFFASTDKTQQTDEIVFLLIPHIVRESILTADNMRPVDTGTGQSFGLRFKDKTEVAAEAASASQNTNGVAPTLQPTTASNAARAAIGTIASEGRPIAPPSATRAAANATAAVAGAPVSLTVVPPVTNQAVGSTFQVAVLANNAHDLFSVPLQLQFDPKVLSLVDVDSGVLLSQDGQAVALVHRDEGNGLVTVSASRPPGTAGVTGQGTVVTLTFKAVAAGDSALTLVKVGAKDSKQNTLPVVGAQGTVHVK
jgi:general secretion pathway protein D